MKNNGLVKLELNLISLTVSSITMEEKARKIREMLREYEITIKVLKYESYHNGHGQGYHDGYFEGFNEGLLYDCQGNKVREWEEIE